MATTNRLDRGTGSVVSRSRVVIAATAIAGVVALFSVPAMVAAGPADRGTTRTAQGAFIAARHASAIDAVGDARSVDAKVTVTVRVSCPRTHRGPTGLLYCDRRP
jgi:hypothetical protein